MTLLALLAPVAADQLHAKPLDAATLLPYPPMHWHSWNLFCGEGYATEQNMREIADALVATGLNQVGYDTVNVVCQGWKARDPVTHQLTQNNTAWPNGMKGLADYLHGKNLKLGCYTGPGKQTCCAGEPGSEGYEDVDMAFFADIGCDHVMVDWCQPYNNPRDTKAAYALIGQAIARSSNPNMIYGIWPTGFGKSWTWAEEAGGHYWRVETDMSNSWDTPGGGSGQPGSVVHNFDTAMSIPGIQEYTKPGRYTFLDNMVIGIPAGGTSARGPGISLEEARSHMTMWVMACSPLLIGVDVRTISQDIIKIIANADVLAVHKDPLAKMAKRIDVGGGVNEKRIDADGDYHVYQRPLADGSFAVMVLNRGLTNLTVDLAVENIGDHFTSAYSIVDLWAGQPLPFNPVNVSLGWQSFDIVPALQLEVAPHGVRFLRFHPLNEQHEEL